MIQRKQTLFLLGVIALSVLQFMIPPSLLHGDLAYYLTGIAVLIGLLSIGCVMSYRKRLLQLKLGKAIILLCCGMMLLLFYDADRTAFPDAASGRVTYGVGVFLPIAQIMLLFLANRAIRKDEELVRSADRIR